MKRVVTAILGGGQGARLSPLTQHRAKPAVPVGGKFRLIDIPISNSLHAGFDRVYVLTQFQSASASTSTSRRPTGSTSSAAASSRSWPPSRGSRTATGTRARPTPSARTSPACSPTTGRRTS